MSVTDLMGKVVLVDRIFKRTYPYDGGVRSEFKKVWKAFHADGRPGWVVGERWIQDGATQFGYGDDPPVWKRDGHSLHCLLVAYWPTMKPVRVPFDGYRLAPPTVQPYRTEMPWTKDQKAEQREEMKDWPRNEKGQWTSK